MRGLPQVQSARHNFCDNPRSHFLRAEVFKREGTFAQFLLIKKKSGQPKGAQGAMAAVGLAALASCLPASQRGNPRSLPGARARPAAPAPQLPPPAPSPAALQPGARRRHKSGDQARPGRGRRCWLVLGYCFNFSGGESKLLRKKFCHKDWGVCGSEISREYLPPEVEGQAGRTGRGIPFMSANTGNA